VSPLAVYVLVVVLIAILGVIAISLPVVAMRSCQRCDARVPITSRRCKRCGYMFVEQVNRER
jgi:hypothetical protein